MSIVWDAGELTLRPWEEGDAAALLVAHREAELPPHPPKWPEPGRLHVRTRA